MAFIFNKIRLKLLCMRKTKVIKTLIISTIKNPSGEGFHCYCILGGMWRAAGLFKK